MTPQNLLQLVISAENDITNAITCGAAWEIWWQVELTLLLRKNNVQAARELPYPAPFNAWSLDLGAKVGQDQYAIEMKVESATNAGRVLAANIQQDAIKIQSFTADPQTPLHRWVLGVGYSAEAKAALQALAPAGNHNAGYMASQTQNGIGVLLLLVTP